MKKIKLIFASYIFMNQNHSEIISNYNKTKSSSSSVTSSTVKSNFDSDSKSDVSNDTITSINGSTNAQKTMPKSIKSNEPINFKSKEESIVSNYSNKPRSTINNHDSKTLCSSSTSHLNLNNPKKNLNSSNRSNIEDFLNNLPINSISHFQKTISERDLIKDNEIIKTQWQSQIKNFSAITDNLNKIMIDLDKKIKESKDENEKIALDSFKNLLSKLNDALKKSNSAIGLEVEIFEVCQAIFILNEKLKVTKDDFEEELLKSKIKEIWDLFYFSKKIEKNSNKKTTLEINSTPFNFNEDVYSIIDYANSTIKKFKTLNDFQNLCKEIPHFFEALNNLALDNDIAIAKTITNFESIISDIKIDNTLPHITNIIVEILPVLNDILTLTILGNAIQIEGNNNAKHTGVTGLFKKKFTPITLIGAGSLRNALMFTTFKVHSSNTVNNYSNYTHNWYTSNYRLPDILNKTSTEKRNNFAQILKLQKTILLKMLEVFTHNYQSKNLLTRKDCYHAAKLLYQLQLISNILIKLESSLDKIQYTEAQIDNMKFYLHSVTSDLNYLKRKPTYRPTQTFYESKKAKEIESLEILLKEKSVIGIQRLSKILSNYFTEITEATIKNEEDPMDPSDNNLFQIKINHNAIKKIQD